MNPTSNLFFAGVGVRFFGNRLCQEKGLDAPDEIHLASRLAGQAKTSESRHHDRGPLQPSVITGEPLVNARQRVGCVDDRSPRMRCLRVCRWVLDRWIIQRLTSPQTSHPNRATPWIGRTAIVSESASDNRATGADAGNESGETPAIQIPRCR